MIELRNVSLVREGRVLVADASLDVRPGEVLAIVGPNGAGKSSLLRLLSGDVRPSSGSVRYLGLEVSGLPPRKRALLRAVMEQLRSPEFDMAVQDVVMLGRYPHHAGAPRAADRVAVEAAMQGADVTHLRDRSYARLSGGEQQRVQLARVTAQLAYPAGDAPARYLMLDEPTASLDPAHQHGTLGVVRELAASGCGVVVVLHQINLAAAHADRIAMMNAGSIVAYGAPHDVLSPGLLSETFGVAVHVLRHPLTGRPVIATGALDAPGALAGARQSLTTTG